MRQVVMQSMCVSMCEWNEAEGKKVHFSLPTADGPTQTRNLEIRPMPSEDMPSGRVVRRCEVVPTPPPSEVWEYTWSDPSGRIVSPSDILSITVSSLFIIHSSITQALHSLSLV